MTAVTADLRRSHPERSHSITVLFLCVRSAWPFRIFCVIRCNEIPWHVSRVDSINKSSAVAETGDRLATIDAGRKVGAAVPISAGGAGSPANTLSHGSMPTSVPSGILVHPTVWPQCTIVTDRQDRTNNGPIA